MTVLVTSQICVLGTKVFTLFMATVLVPSSDILITNICTLFMVTTLVPSSNLLHTKDLTLLMVTIMVPCSDILGTNVFIHGDSCGAKFRISAY